MKPFPQPIWRITGATFVVPALIALVATVALAAVAPAGRILVVNSDVSVARYAEVQLAFKDTLGVAPMLEVDWAKEGDPAVRRAVLANPSVIYCIGGNAYQSAQKYARGKAIVLSTAINWERFKVDGRTTRVIANELPAVQQLTLFRHFFPKLQRVGVIYNPAINKLWFDQAVLAGKEVGVEVIGHAVNRNPQVAAELAKLAAKVDALWLASDPVVLENEAAVKLYFDRADAAGKPVFTYTPAFTTLGATLVLAPDMPTIGRQAAGVVQDHPGSQPVSTPAGSEVTLNLKRVQQYRMEFNREALDSVNNIIR